jgi:glycosyltransferase involved in cell wall biosynthesis
MNKTKLFLVVNVDWFFLSHRLPIALEALKRGYDITVLAIEEEAKGDEIRSHGLKFIPLPSTRGGKNIFSELNLIRFLLKIYKTHKPDIVHHVAIKPVLYGSIAAKFAKIPKIINAVSGLGTAFINPKPFSPVFILVKSLYKYSFRNKRLKVIVQNEDDKVQLLSFGVLKKEQIRLIKGSGVDLTDFSYCEEPSTGPIRVVLAARMLWDKGIGEYVEAARQLKAKYQHQIDFILAGKVDEQNSTNISESQLLTWNKEGVTQWIGYQTNMAQIYRDAHIVVLPSYREGLPKSLIEACAIGRPIITTDVPGCRVVVEEGVNGFLIPAKNSGALAIALEKMLNSKELRLKMGKEGRILAEKEFSITSVLDKTFSIYEEA